MKEHPILFSGPMVRAILEGRKTQTRRIVKDAPEWATEVVPSLLLNRGDLFDFRGELQNPKAIKCPYGAPGDRLWVRETWCLAHPDYHDTDKEAGTRPVKDGRFCFYAATDDVDTGDGSPWRPSIHMPRWASRLTLAVTAVRVERLQAISDDDAKAEGVKPFTPPHGCISPDQRVPGPGFDGARLGDQPHRLPFAHLLDDINGDRAAWASNPWVWVVEFKRIGGAP